MLTKLKTNYLNGQNIIVDAVKASLIIFNYENFIIGEIGINHNGDINIAKNN